MRNDDSTRAPSRGESANRGNNPPRELAMSHGPPLDVSTFFLRVETNIETRAFSFAAPNL